MSRSVGDLERRIAYLESRLPVQFAWAQGKTQPKVGSHALTLWEDTLGDRAKLLMRRGLRVYVFESHEAGDAPPVITPAVAIPTTVNLTAGAVGVATTRYALEDHRHQLSANALALTVRHLVSVVDPDGFPLAGLTLGTALVYDNGALQDPAPETVTVVDLGGGNYRLSYAPTVRGALYRLRVTSSGNIVTPGEFQDLIWSA